MFNQTNQKRHPRSIFPVLGLPCQTSSGDLFFNFGGISNHGGGVGEWSNANAELQSSIVMCEGRPQSDAHMGVSFFREHLLDLTGSPKAVAFWFPCFKPRIQSTDRSFMRQSVSERIDMAGLGVWYPFCGWCKRDRKGPPTFCVGF